MSLRLEKIDTKHSPQYAQWADLHGDIFSAPSWIQIQADSSCTYVLRDDSNWLGCFTLNQETKWGIRLFRNPHFSPHICWSWNHAAHKTTSQHNSWKAAMDLMIGIFKNHKLSKIQFSFPTHVNDLQNFIWKGFQVQPKYTYHIDLHSSFDLILSQISSSHRNHFNKAKKDGIEWVIQHSPQEMEILVTSTFKRKRKKYHPAYLHNILNNFCNEENSMMCFASLEGKVIAGATVIFNRKKAYLLLSGYHADNKHGGAGIGCIIHLIESCQKRQIPLFDFEGSMIPEVEVYFRGFGGRLVPYFSVSQVGF